MWLVMAEEDVDESVDCIYPYMLYGKYTWAPNFPFFLADLESSCLESNSVQFCQFCALETLLCD